jgi:hypothetical protein
MRLLGQANGCGDEGGVSTAKIRVKTVKISQTNLSPLISSKITRKRLFLNHCCEEQSKVYKLYYAIFPQTTRLSAKADVEVTNGEMDTGGLVLLMAVDSAPVRFRSQSDTGLTRFRLAFNE